MGSRRWFGLAVALCLAPGCVAYRPATATRPAAPGSLVRVTFTPPRDVPVDAHGATPLILERLSRLEGRLAGLDGDTLYLAIEDTGTGRPRRIVLGAAGGPAVRRFASESSSRATAAIVADANTRIEVLQVEKGRTVVLTLGIAAALMGVGLLALSSSFNFGAPMGGGGGW